MPAALQHSRPSHAHAPQRRAHSVIYSRRILLFIHGREMGLLFGRCSEEASVRAFGPVVGVRPCSVQPRLLLLDHERVEETAAGSGGERAGDDAAARGRLHNASPVRLRLY